MLWLRETIQTGHPAFIDKALDAATRIKTPAKELERRYARHLTDTTGNTIAAACFGTDDPDMLTEADRFCIRTLKGAKSDGFGFDDDEAAARFREHPELVPHTLENCLYELAFHHDLYRLRNAATGWDGPPELYARETFTISLLAEIRPRHKAEAKAVLSYLLNNDLKNNRHFDIILENLLG